MLSISQLRTTLDGGGSPFLLRRRPRYLFVRFYPSSTSVELRTWYKYPLEYILNSPRASAPPAVVYKTFTRSAELAQIAFSPLALTICDQACTCAFDNRKKVDVSVPRCLRKRLRTSGKHGEFEQPSPKLDFEPELADARFIDSRSIYTTRTNTRN